MNPCSFLLAALLAAPPASDVELLKGGRHSGRLLAIDDSTVQLETEGGPLRLPLADVLEIRFPAAAAREPSVGPRVELVDGTRLTCREFSVAAGQARLDARACGTLAVPIARVAHVRFGVSTTRLDEQWVGHLARESRSDLLIVRKDDVLDFLEGVVGDAGDKVGFLLDGEELSVARERVYGIIFRRKAPALPKPLCQVSLAGGDALSAAALAAEGDELQLRLGAGPEALVPLAAVAALDFSAGKVRYLSQLEPRDVKYVPFFDAVSLREYRRDRSLDGTPLSLAGKTYARGVAINSQTTLRYRIGGEYTRFQAVLGIDDSVRRLGHVQVKISGDGRPLFDAEVRGTDAPRPLDLDVSGVRDLEILVDFATDANIGDHLDLADAKLIK